MTSAVARVIELVQRESGVRMPGASSSAVARTLLKATELDAEEFIRGVGDDPETLMRLLDEVTIKETFFLRHEQQLRAIDWAALLESAHRRGSARIDVWTAGCSTGEEPYTIALLALEAFGHAAPPVRILGTDISRSALAAAAVARYRARSLHELPAALRLRYLEAHGDGTETVREPARHLVELARHNLVRDPSPPAGRGPFDLILCRNVLIYFDPPTVEAVHRKLTQALQPEGELMLGASDAICVTSGRLDACNTSPRAATRTPRASRSMRPSRRRHVPEQVAASPSLTRGDAEACYVAALVALEGGDAVSAVGLLRRALYIEPTLVVAAFQLGRAHEAAHDRPAARRSYERALRIQAESPDDEMFLEQVDLADVASACHHRLAALA